MAQHNKGLGCSYFFTQVQVGLNSFSIDEFNNLVINNVNCILYLTGLLFFLFLNDVKKKHTSLFELLQATADCSYAIMTLI